MRCCYHNGDRTSLQFGEFLDWNGMLIHDAFIFCTCQYNFASTDHSKSVSTVQIQYLNWDRKENVNDTG